MYHSLFGRCPNCAFEQFMVRLMFLGLAVFASLPGIACADAEDLHVHPLSVLPFAALLLAIALLPLLAAHFWHSNFRKFIVATAISLPVLAYLGWLGDLGLHRLAD